MGTAVVLLTLVVLAFLSVKTPTAFADDSGTSLGAPRNLRVSLAENGRIVLSWDPPATDAGWDITGYMVGWSWESEGIAISKAAFANGLSHTITGLTDGVQYAPRVIAVNSAGDRVPSQDIRARPKDTIPPRLLSVVVNASQIILTYTGPPDRNSVPPVDAFSVMVGGSAREVKKVTLDGRFVRLALTSAATSSDAVSVSYAVPTDEGSPRIQDSWGSAAASFNHKRATWADTPGTPRILFALLEGSGELRVYWENPLSDGGGEIIEYKVQWKSGDKDYHPSRQKVASGSSNSRTIKGLTNGVPYTLRVVAVNAVGDGSPSPEVSETPLNAEMRLRQFIEEIAAKYAADHPWLRMTWEYMNEPGFDLRIGPDWGLGGVVYPECFNEGNFRKCKVDEMEIRGDEVGSTTVLLHEMAHVFTLTDDLLVQPAPWAAAQMYFATHAFRGCPAEEILADVLALSVNDRIGVPYWRPCNEDYGNEDYGYGKTDPLTAEALAVVKSAVSGQLPQWFAETYNDTEGNPDLEQLWADLKAMPSSTYRDLVLYRFRDQSGGYCDDRKVAGVLNSGGDVITNPWRDGGCVPEAPVNLTAVAGPAELTLAWNAPENDGGDPIKGYRVEWKSLGEEYGVPRLAVVNDLSDLSHTIAGLSSAAAHTLRVFAFNIFGDGAFSAEITTIPGSDAAQPHPVSASVNGAVLTLTYEEALDADPPPAADAFRVYAGGAVVEVSDLSVVGGSISLTLAHAVEYREGVTLSYTAPQEGLGSRIRSGEGHPAASFSNLAVANETPAPPNRPATGAPSISGKALAGETLTAETYWIADEDGLDNVSYLYQWIARDGTTDTDIEYETAPTYELSGDDVGKTIKVRVTFTDDLGNEETLTSVPTGEASDAAEHSPEQSSAWSATLTVGSDGTNVGYDLFTGLGSVSSRKFWVGDPTTSHTIGSLYEDDGGRLSFVVNSPVPTSFMLTVGELQFESQDAEGTKSHVAFVYSWPRGDLRWSVGEQVEVNLVLSESSVSAEPNAAATGALTITGTPQVGETLTADTSAIVDADGLTNVSYGYQWLANDGTTDTDIAGKTDSTYILATTDVGKTVKVKVSFTDDADNHETLTSEATEAVAATVPTEPLGLTVSRGSQIQELDASWQAPSSNGGSAVTGYKVQWKEAADSWDTEADVSEATETGTTHTITGLTGGVEYAIRVIATNDVGDGPASTEAKGTPAGGVSEQTVEPENTAPTGLPSISGTPQVEQTLAADTSGIADADGLTNVSYSYQWVVNDGATDADIEGATASTYTPSVSEVGKTVKVRVSFSDDADHEETLTSAATEAVAATKPGVPGHLKVFPHDTGALDVYWEAPASDGGSAITGYKVQWKESADSWDTASAVSEETASGTTHSITGLTDGVEYRVRVMAVNDVGDSPPSAEKPGTPRETQAPQMVRPRVDGATLRVLYDEGLDAGSAPLADAFDVRVACTCDDTTWRDEEAKRAVESVSVDGDTVVLTLVSAATSEDVVVVSYTPPSDAAAARIRDLAGNAAAGFNSTEVFNDTDEVAEAEGDGEADTPLTVSVENPPASHNGTDAFTFEIRFSEEFALSYKTLRDHAFNVTGGEVEKAQRMDRDSDTPNIWWLITVEPDGNGDVTVTLPATTDCTDDGAICTGDGRMLSNRLEFSVSGPGQ